MPQLDRHRGLGMTFDSLLVREMQRLSTTLPALSPVITRSVLRFDGAHHGDFPRWRDAIDALLAGDAAEPALRQLMPWRKGPWQFGELHIDTEWRSDWKWQRLEPHLAPLSDRRVLDIGSGNGYFGWRLLEHGAAAVIGVDPTLLFCMQHLAAISLLGPHANWVLPLALEELDVTTGFDTVLSMGVIYHRRDPADHLKRLFAHTRPGGELVLESLVVDGTTPLLPHARYARMRNVHIVPTPETLCCWLEEAGFRNCRVVDITPTSTEEQRTTDWMQFESLAQSLDPRDAALTVEGYPAPCRAIVLASRPD
ncbi:MAG: tRNA 5-methoxyuridine(34)/uridine 5-oxyacetic acid(34) synthase CmoB [Pseudomonadales bacterium]|nr:tRNA 5-methoxyuridine(34)/uridine 5-oxyacetic acid(34) synthase CmoB [Pseudomonadales bacterium]